MSKIKLRSWEKDRSPYRVALARAMTAPLDGLKITKGAAAFANLLLDVRYAVDEEVSKIEAAAYAEATRQAFEPLLFYIEHKRPSNDELTEHIHRVLAWPQEPKNTHVRT